MTDTPSDGTEPRSESEVGPEEVGTDLFRRLDLLDDRLQRSQEQMLSLIDRKLNDSQGPSSPDGSTSESPEGTSAGAPAPVSPDARWAPPPPLAPANGAPVLNDAAPEGLAPAPRVADQESMDAWFGGASASSLAAVPPPVTPEPGSASSNGREGAAGGEPSGSGPEGPVPPAASEVASIVPAHRPAWQSNAMAVAVTALVVVVGLFLVGLF